MCSTQALYMQHAPSYARYAGQEWLGHTACFACTAVAGRGHHVHTATAAGRTANAGRLAQTPTHP
jgi:hypothetical protein